MSEKELIEKLSEICKKPGYIHALSLYTLRIFYIPYGDKLRKSDIAKANHRHNLIRNEQNLLLLLMTNYHIDESELSFESIIQYIEETRIILEEIHNSINSRIFKNLFENKKKIKDKNSFFREPEVWREAIFYGPESAYFFQYKELIYSKFSNDDEWFKSNKGFSISEGLEIIKTIGFCLEAKRASKLLDEEGYIKTIELFSFTIPELISLNQNLDKDIVGNFIKSFLRSKDKIEVSKIDDFNVMTATPIISINNGVYFIAHLYSLYESLYESPFYWMNSDKKYRAIASKNRGDFTENSAEKYLLRVFGENNVYKNINIFNGKDKISEIDVLIVFANYCIILQAKSKKLTLLSKQGNEISLKNDFKLAIQDSYDQALICAKVIANENYRLINNNGEEVFLNRDIKEIFPVCVVAEHYPSLSIQSHQFIKYETNEIIHEPLITDLFFLDVLTEFLSNPLYFLSYLDRRGKYFEKLMVSQELSALGFHLSQNLYFDNDYHYMHIQDDFTYAIDVAMSVRRENMDGLDTPIGILTRLKDTQVYKILENIIKLDNYYAVHFGFYLLSLSEEYIRQIDSLIILNTKNTFNTDREHDLTFKLDEQKNVGIIIHINNLEIKDAMKKLLFHAKTRKYKEKSNLWFGLIVQPNHNKEPNIKNLLILNEKWTYDENLEEHQKFLSNKYNYDLNQRVKIKTKIGRNESCPCGSGIKYKKCCLE
ncbi:YecA family protein [Acinetobacter baumannii]|uniref:YecA family protein n=1 Tax=Acinetobacter baumannii TaxID=470 RepID=UPI00359FFD29